MIAFSCSHCGMKLKVQDEFAGRQSKCPTCKRPLTVPMPSATAYISPQQIDGVDSGLAKAGLDTLNNDPTGRKPNAMAGQRSVNDALAQRQKNNQRYVIEGEIARGGMGAVLRAVDCDIRREVAIKYMLDDNDPKKKARFIDEAQINGQLEHPNIVPVYDLGIDAQKRPFIMMKMVKGHSLKDVLDQLRDNPKQAENDFSLGRLLNILVNVCNALSFAHARGVVHRDLKPANIMLGDFGEVYVMDWGLAKVLNQPGAADLMPQAVMATATASVSGRNSKVVTNRAPDADLTQDGSVLGTPVYMPPEQTTGNPNAIDQRSDIYSLGAILYEMLTLQPPVTKEGGYVDILMRVMQGEILLPEKRNPKRAWKIPKELSAIAMKSLAKDKENRYPTVDALRQDIERFQEGRSVSAKEDTKREMIWKFVKRNQGFSTGIAAAFLVLIASLFFVTQAWLRTREVNAAFQKQTDDAVPALLKAAWFAVDKRDYKTASEQVDLALVYAPDNAEARLLRGQLLIARQDFTAARQEFGRYMRLRTTDAEAKKLMELCERPHPDDEATSLEFAYVFNKQEAYGLIDGVLARWGKTSAKARDVLLQKYQKQIEAAWTGQRKRLEINSEGLRLNLGRADVRDLSPLKGMPLTSLNLSGCELVSDLSPLKGMPLTTLDLSGCGLVQNLTPLHGMKLTTLNLGWCGQVRDLSPLKGMPLTTLSLFSCGQVSDLTPLKGMEITSLSLGHCRQVNGDLTPLKSMKLTTLDLTNCGQVSDLMPLKGMRLTSLSLMGCGKASDLTPLQGMPLTALYLVDCGNLSDLTPLQGMNLTEILLTPKHVKKGMEVLRQMRSLKTIGIAWQAEYRWPAADFWKKHDKGEFK